MRKVPDPTPLDDEWPGPLILVTSAKGCPKVFHVHDVYCGWGRSVTSSMGRRWSPP